MFAKWNREDKFIALTLVGSLSGVTIGALLRNPAVFGISTFVLMTAFVVVTFWWRSPRLMWLMLFGAVVGFGELWSDWLHVEVLRSLVYTDYFGFRIMASPSYMPFGWWFTAVQFGYIALRLAEVWGPRRALALVTLLGMSIPPWYEEFAAPARAWYYPPHGPMLSHTPVWIILTYGGCMFSIGTMAWVWYREGAWGRAIVAGIFAAAGIAYSALVFYQIFL